MSRQLTEYLGVLTPSPDNRLRRRRSAGGESELRRRLAQAQFASAVWETESDQRRFGTPAGSLSESELRAVVASQLNRQEEENGR